MIDFAAKTMFPACFRDLDAPLKQPAAAGFLDINC